MPRLARLIHWIDAYTEATGRYLAWLCLLMTVITCTVVVLRYGLAIGSVALQESVTYMHALLFMACAAFALKRGAHVRVDIFYRQFSPRTRAWVNAVGGIVLLLPFSIFTLGISANFVYESWHIFEGSAESGGIQAVFLLKSLIPLLALNLIVQGLAEILRNAMVLVEAES